MDNKSGGEPSNNTVPFLSYIMLTSLFCGALVMVIEVLGSRVIGPFFGSSLFVWTSLITVTLVALSIGYAVGGICSDRWHSPDYLYLIILLSGACIMLVPFLKGVVLTKCVLMGLRTGALVSATVLFGPSLFLLGCVSPYIIKIAAREMKNIGRTVGLFYAISTVGSFLGTLCTGFILIAYFAVNQILLTVGVALVVMSVGYFVFFRKKWLASVVVLLPLLMPGGESPRSKVLSNGTTVTRVYGKDNFYGNLMVLDYSMGEKHTRELVIDGLVQGGIDMNNRLSVYGYAYYLQSIPYLMNPQGKNCLVIGLGAGLVPMWFERMGVRTDVVDINPDVVAIARQYFGLNVSGDIVVEDARYYLNSNIKKYDYIILDVFNGDTTPGHILSKESLQLISQRLSATGILSVNLIGSLKNKTYMTASVVRTFQHVFPTVQVFPNFSPDEMDGVGNLTLIAHNQAPLAFDPDDINAFPVHPLAFGGNRITCSEFHFPKETRAIVLTDDYNPIDFYDVWMKEKIRKGILEYTEWDMAI
jgi:spermidine synthase